MECAAAGKRARRIPSGQADEHHLAPPAGAFGGGAEIRKSSKFLEFDRRQEKQKEAEDASQRLQLGAVIGVHLEPFGLIWTINNPDVSKCCIELLFELRRGINTNGFNKMQDYSILKRIYGDPS